ncbi:hypothetical protein AAY473_003435 [Plecturocebus cupreus]
MEEGVQKVGCSVVSLNEVIKAEDISIQTSVKKAKLFTLTMEEAEKWREEKRSSRSLFKDSKVLIPVFSSGNLLSAYIGTHYRRDALWELVQESSSGKGLRKTVSQVTMACDLCIQNNPHTQSIPPALATPVQHWGTYLGEHWQINITQMPPLLE